MKFYVGKKNMWQTFCTSFRCIFLLACFSWKHVSPLFPRFQWLHNLGTAAIFGWIIHLKEAGNSSRTWRIKMPAPHRQNSTTRNLEWWSDRLVFRLLEFFVHDIFDLLFLFCLQVLCQLHVFYVFLSFLWNSNLL